MLRDAVSFPVENSDVASSKNNPHQRNPNMMKLHADVEEGDNGYSNDDNDDDCILLCYTNNF